MLVGEDFVHRFGADGDDGPDLVAVNRLGDVRSSRGRVTACSNVSDL